MNSGKIPLVAFLLFLAAGISIQLTAQEKKVHVRIINNGKSTDSVYTVSDPGGSSGEENQNVVIVTNVNYNGKSAESKDSVIELVVETPDVDIQGMGNKHPGVMIMRSRNGEEEEEIKESNEESPEIYSFTSGNCKAKCCENDSCMKKGMKREFVIYMDDSSHSGRMHKNVKYRVTRNNRQMENIEEEMASIPITASKDTTIVHISPQGDTIKIHRKVLKDGKIQQEVMVNKHSKDSTDTQYYSYRINSDKKHVIIRTRTHPYEDEENFDFMMPPKPPSPPGVQGMDFDFPGMSEGIDENADFGKIKVIPLAGKNLIRISLELSGKENTTIRINDEKGKAIFEEKVKDLTGKYVRDIDMGSAEKGKYSLGIDRGKSTLSKAFIY